MTRSLMTRKPGFLFYAGFLVFLIGYFSVFMNFTILELLKPIGTALSIFAIIQWCRISRFGEKFKEEKNEDGLTYFWNKIVLRLWSGMFFAFMFFSTLTYGSIETYLVLTIIILSFRLAAREEILLFKCKEADFTNEIIRKKT